MQNLKTKVGNLSILQRLALLVVIAGLAVGLSFAFVVGRNFINDARVTKVEQDTELIETIDRMMLETNAVKNRGGAFVDADSFHTAEGMAEIFTTDGNPVLVLDEAFRVRGGPDLVVYLSKNRVADGEPLGEFVSLGELQSSDGKQAYSLPEDYADFNSVVVWCRAFGVNFGSANFDEA